MYDVSVDSARVHASMPVPASCVISCQCALKLPILQNLRSRWCTAVNDVVVGSKILASKLRKTRGADVNVCDQP
jgi:hypothetical protein